MGAMPIYVSPITDHEITFSVCSLVRDPARYQVLLDTFEAHGFSEENSEFLAADNRQENQFDGYDWQRHLRPLCRGKYLIFCHEDISLIEHGFDDLVARLEALDAHDPTWLLAGVAGGVWRPGNHTKRQTAMRISDRFGENRHIGELPARVESLDECFIIMRRERPALNSYDLSGFHFYGADICLQAELLGGASYVIDFHLYHAGEGAGGPPYRRCRRALAEKYRKIFPTRHLHTTTGVHNFGGGWNEL